MRCPHCASVPKVQPITAVSSRRSDGIRGPSLSNELSTGALLSERYRLGEKLGEGGMGTVFSAVDEELDRAVAVKLLHAQFLTDTEIVERFERESRLMAKLDHPNIVSVYDVGRASQQPYIVMKKLNGMTLSQILKTRGGLPPSDTVALVRQLAQGLDFIHHRGFIHRDIKASNIFVSSSNEVTILDFGILRARGAQAGLTRQGMVMGTPHYMAPEQALGLTDVDFQVDLYSLGVVIFECLSGTLPFQAESELQLIHLQAHAPPPNILERAPWLPQAVGQVLLRALSKNPSARFESGESLVDAVAFACGLDTPLPRPRASVAPRKTPAAATAQLFSVRPAPAPMGPPSEPVLEAVVSTQTPVSTKRSAWWLLPAAAPVLAIGLWWIAPFANETSTTATSPDIVTPPMESPVADTANTEPAPAPVESAAATAGAPEQTQPETVEPAAAAPVAVIENAERKSTIKRRSRVNVVTTHQGEPYWAQVSVDGVPKGRTPLQLDLDPGKHALKIERSGFRSTVREIRVASGKPLVLRIALTP
jgi:eukaryotic-like serine/threonine-protein kinase